MNLIAKTIFWLMPLLLIAGGLTRVTAQGQPTRVSVIDAMDAKPVSYAHVCFESPDKTFRQYTVTDEQGEASCQVPDTAIVAVSFVGYETRFETVVPGQRCIIRLMPNAALMEEVIVTAQFSPQRADKSIYRVKVINSKQIEMKAATNLGDLLRSEVNIRTNQDGVLGSSISLQGLSGENVKFLIDGIPVIGRMNGNIDLGQLGLHNADHVEIIEGPMSVVYGSNALAGVINIITRQNEHDRLTLRANGYAESAGVVNADAAFAIKHGAHVLSFSGGRNFFGGFSNPDTSRARQWKPKQQVFADASWLYSHKNLKIKTAGQFFDELLLNRGNLIAPYYENAFDNQFYTRRYVARTDLSWQPAQNHRLTMLAAWSGFNRRKETWFNDLTTLTQSLTTNSEDQDTTAFNNVNIRGQWSRSSDDAWFNWQAGIDANIESASGKRIDEGLQQMGDYASFVSLLLRPHPVIEIQPGARAAYNSRYTAPLVYSLNVKWNLSEKLTLRGSAARGFRAPALKELYLFFVDVNHNIRGNPSLMAEDSDNFNLAFQFQHERSRFNITTGFSMFYNHIRNIITLAEQEKQLYTYVNVSDFRSQGMQINATFRFFPRLVITTGAGLTGRSNSVAGGRYAWTTDINSEITYQWLRQNMSMTVWYKYTGRLPQFYINARGELSESFLAAYHMMDVSVGKSFLGDRVTIHVGVKNLFDITSIESGGESGGVHSGGSSTQPVGWGRSYFVKLGFRLLKKNS